MKNPEYRKLLSDGIVHKNEIDHVHKGGLSRSLFRDLTGPEHVERAAVAGTWETRDE